MDPRTKALADSLLAKIRTEARPLVKIHTGPIESLRSDIPGMQFANKHVENWLEDPKNHTNAGIYPAALESEFMRLAEWAHPISWAHTQDDAEAWELLRRIVLDRAGAGDEQAKNMLPHLMVSDGFNAFGWYGKWYHHGCQSIEIDDRYAASLAATKIAKSELDYVQLPWPIFLVRVPRFLQGLLINGEPLRLILVNHVKYSGAVSVTGTQAKEVEGLDVSSTFDLYSLHLLTANKYRILPTRSLAQWAAPNPMKSFDEFRLVEVEHDEVARRQLEILGRLVLGAIIAMNDPKLHRRYVGSGKKPLLGSPRYGTHNKVVLHKIGRPVKVDARETISAYVSGRADRATTVRTLVAGHWKNQPHGPKSSLRRWQHVECYWRGDEGAPLIVRPHVLTGVQDPER